MRKITLSRGPGLDMDVCQRNAGNKYDLVIMAAARSREIAAIAKNNEDPEANVGSLSSHSNVAALYELQSKQYGREYLRKVKIHARRKM